MRTSSSRPRPRRRCWSGEGHARAVWRRRRPDAIPLVADGGGAMTDVVTPGSTFAGYRIESLVGRGGMGVVYRATDLVARAAGRAEADRARAGRRRALPRALPAESRLAASLDHPNVVPIYDAGERDGQLYLAMRFVEGSDLRTLLDARGRGSSRSGRSRSSRQVAGALDAAHRARARPPRRQARQRARSTRTSTPT